MNKKIDEQLKKMFQKFWDENHIRINSADIHIEWIETSTMQGIDYKIAKLVVLTR